MNPMPCEPLGQLEDKVKCVTPHLFVYAYPSSPERRHLRCPLCAEFNPPFLQPANRASWPLDTGRRCLACSALHVACRRGLRRSTLDHGLRTMDSALRPRSERLWRLSASSRSRFVANGDPYSQETRL